MFDISCSLVNTIDFKEKKKSIDFYKSNNEFVDFLIKNKNQYSCVNVTKNNPDFKITNSIKLELVMSFIVGNKPKEIETITCINKNTYLIEMKNKQLFYYKDCSLLPI